MTDSNRELLQLLGNILLRCWLLGFGFLLLLFLTSQLATKFIYNLHTSMFGLSTHELDIILYCSLALIKLTTFLLFFTPWLAILLTLRKS